MVRVDRGWRSSLAMLTDLDRWEARDIKLVATTQPIDTTGPMGRLMVQILAAFASCRRGALPRSV